MPEISPSDRDMMIRTIIGEAGNEPALGQVAVAHAIMNRLGDGNFGKSPTQIVLAPGQFEPWQTRSGELATIPRNSTAYQQVGQIVDGVAQGNIPDPTKGATHFLNEDVVRQRRGGALPDWAQGPGLQIGAHTFHNPKQKMAQATTTNVTDADIADTLKLLKIKPAQISSDVAQDNDISETMKLFGVRPTEQKSDETPIPKERPKEADKKNPFRSGITAQLSEGMPIVGPLLNKALAATTAGIEPYLPGKKAKGTFGERYDKNLSDIVAAHKSYSDENPGKSVLANLAGGGVMLGPLASSKAGRIAFGIDGPTFGSRLAQGIAGGSVLAGTDAALRNESPVTGGIIGAAAGALGPLVASATRGVTNFAANHLWPRQGPLKDLSSTALSKLAAGMEGETPASIAAGRERMGPAGYLADVSPGMTDVAGGIADTPGAAKTAIRESYRTRAAQQGERIEQALNDASVPKTNIEDFKNFLVETRKAAADPLYEQWRSAAVQPTPKLKELIPRLEKAGAFNMAEELSGISGEPINKTFFTTGAQKEYPTAQAWDYVKRGLDRRIDQAYTAGDKTLGRSLVGLKNEMLDEIEKTSAGKVWKQARSEFAERSAILDQIEAGRDTFLGGRSGLSVDELKEELKGLKGPELHARIVGMRDAAAQAMGDTMRGDTTLRNKLLAPNNQEKMKLLLGEKKAEKLIKSMQQEKFLSEQDTNVRGGSQTTPKKERVDALAPIKTPEYNPNFTQPLSFIPPHLLEQLRPGHMVDAWRGRAHSNALNQLAPLLTTQEGPQLNDLIKALQNESARRSAIANRSNSAGNALSGLVAIPGVTTARRQFLPQQ